MLKLPVCPYCNRKYDYKQTVAVMKSDKSTCKCGKTAEVKYKSSCAIMAVLFVLALVAINTFMFFKANNRTVAPNFVITVGAIIVFMILTPFKVRLKEIEGQRTPEPKRKKNRHRHQKTKNSDVTFKENPLEGTSFDN